MNASFESGVEPEGGSRRGRILGIDPGERRVGLAISDPRRVIASPLEVIDRRRAEPVARIAAVCREHDVGEIVVGLPVGLSGREGPAVEAARELGSQVAASTGHDVVYWDERFTSVTAESALLEAGMRRESRRDRRDMVAAAVILQNYLDHQRNTSNGDATKH